ncbi:Transcription factor IWS1 [Colletotrichum chlorophyti]|uniref:Transcription factor IWS1 n=1 Tax=Colletotrichum chlorophyti TaxID=708187 RepID=A0A1Q8S0G0_9PEZI|nr:Transcription factor IWS1 [Colletotrichum chlorophyti]
MSDIESPPESPAAVDRDDHFENEEPTEGAGGADANELSDDQLSEIDEDQFEDYDPETANIEDRPVAVDEDVAKTLKASKRKAPAEGEKARKPKEGRREKKRSRDDEVSGDVDGDAGRPARKSRRAAAEGERKPRSKVASPEVDDESHLSPEERRRRAIDRALDAAMKGPVKRKKKKDEIDLEDEIDEQIADLKVAMERACEADNSAREAGQPAVHKLKLLPQVTGLLNRNNIQHAILDPDTNFLQHVKFFLEPLNDGSLPAYNIQRDIFSALIRLPIEKEALLSSGIGKVVYFYTRSKRPEPGIKRMAERLLGDWSRPILKRTDDYKKRHVETREFDYEYVRPVWVTILTVLTFLTRALKMSQRQAGSSQFTLTQRPSQSAREAEREAMLAPVVTSNRARPGGLPSSYTIAPKSTYDVSRAPDHRPIGAGGLEAFRKMTQKGKKR